MGEYKFRKKYWSFINERRIIEELIADPSSIGYNSGGKLKALCKWARQKKYENGYGYGLSKEEMNKFLKCSKDWLEADGKWIKGLNVEETRRFLDDFCMKNFNGFCLATEDARLRSLVNKSKSKDWYTNIKEMKDIVIYKEELEWIVENAIDIDYHSKYEIEKLLFMMLVLGKSNCKSDAVYCNYDDSTIFGLAKFYFVPKYEGYEEDRYGRTDENGNILKIRRRVKRQEVIGKMLYKLLNTLDENGKKKFIAKWSQETKAGATRQSYLLTYARSEGEEIFRYSYDCDVEAIIFDFLNWREEYGNYDYLFCKECGKTMPKYDRYGKRLHGNTKKYCTACAKKVSNRQKNKSNKKNKKAKNMNNEKGSKVAL